MAWAVRFKIEFGRFFPLGNFSEFGERLHTYFTQKMTAEQRAVFHHENYYEPWVFQKFSREIGAMYTTNLPLVTPLQDHEWPHEYRAERSIKSLGSIVTLPNGVLAVDETMKGLIEGLEPGIHQFRPINFLQPNSEIFPGTYFTMIIGQFRDSFIPEPETEDTLWQRSSYLDPDKGRTFTGKYTFSALSAERYARLPLSAEAIAGAHLWRERNLIGPDFFISDALHDAIKKAKLKMPQNFKVKEA